MKLSGKEYRRIAQRNYNDMSMRQKFVNVLALSVQGLGAIGDGMQFLINGSTVPNAIFVCLIILGIAELCLLLFRPGWAIGALSLKRIQESKILMFGKFVMMIAAAYYVKETFDYYDLVVISIALAYLIWFIDMCIPEYKESKDQSQETKDYINKYNIIEHKQIYMTISISMIVSGVIDLFFGFSTYNAIPALSAMVGVVLLSALYIPVMRDALIGDKHHSLVLLFCVLSCIEMVYVYTLVNSDDIILSGINVFFFIPVSTLIVCSIIFIAREIIAYTGLNKNEF